MDVKRLEKILQLQTYGMYYHACHQWAKFFEDIDMAWVYCPDSGRGSELDKVADFYLPDQDAYFIVDLGRPDRGYTNCEKLSEKFGKIIVLGGDTGRFRIFEEGENYSPSESWLCRCAACGRYFFLNSDGDYMCKVCGEYDGDHHLQGVRFGDRNSFEAKG